MLRTEEEAKRCWCPFARVTATVPGGVDGYAIAAVNRGGDGSADEVRCIASGCMAWRWKELQVDDAFTEAVKKAAFEINDQTSSRSKAVKHVMANRAAYGLRTEPYLGFCGLAGKPD